MKFYPIICLLLFWNTAHAVDPGFGIPDNEFTASLEASGGKISNSFSDFLDSIGGSIGFLINIPLGRSLQKEKASLANPRHLTIAGNTFVGYAQSANQIELISWNPKAGQYDFMIISDFAPAKTPKLSMPPRNLCLSCHQAGGPIFPRIPWSETDAPDGEDIVFQAMQALNPKAEKGAAPFGFDDAVRGAADRIRLRKICESYCQDDACKIRLLAVALRASVENFALLGGFAEVPNISDEDLAKIILNSKEAQAFQADQKAIFKDGFATPSSLLPDRDPLAKGADGGLSTVILGSDIVQAQGAEFAKSTQPFEYREDTNLVDTFEPNIKIKKIIGITAEADPATPRPKVTNFFEGMSTLDQSQKFFGALTGACFGLDSSTENTELFDAKLIHKLQSATLSDFLKNSPNYDLLLKQWPPQKELILATLKGEKVSPPATTNTPIDNGHPTVTNNSDNSAQSFLFSKYCSECHSGNGVIVTGYELPLGDLSLLKKYRQGKILDYIKRRKMPSADAATQPSEEERAAMIQLLEEAK